MIFYNLLLDIIKYTVAGVGVVYIAFYLFKPYLDRSERVQLLELKKTISNQTLPLRLQAYERLILLIERITPANMLLRLNSSGLSAQELHSLIVSEIRSEYQHNVTQQIYVGNAAWAVVKRVKEDTLSVVNNAVKALPENVTAFELSKIILGHLSRLEENPYDIATNLVKKEVEELF
jgi:hypothetical protein